MRPAAAVGLVLVVACTKPTEGTVSATSPTSAPTSSSSATGPLGPAVFHPITCPPPPARPPRPATRGCESCADGEFCQPFEDHGRTFGTCMKSACNGDADCRGALCVCGPPNRCFPGNCRSSADCGGRECAPDRWRYGHGQGVYCRTDRDTCKLHEDCSPDQECAYLADHWGCRPTTPAPPPG